MRFAAITTECKNSCHLGCHQNGSSLVEQRGDDLEHQRRRLRRRTPPGAITQRRRRAGCLQRAAEVQAAVVEEVGGEYARVQLRGAVQDHVAHAAALEYEFLQGDREGLEHQEELAAVRRHLRGGGVEMGRERRREFRPAGVLKCICYLNSTSEAQLRIP